MRVSRPNLINVALFIKFLVKSGELEFVKVTNDVENFHLKKRLKNSIEKATLMSLGIFRESKNIRCMTKTQSLKLKSNVILSLWAIIQLYFLHTWLKLR